MTAQEGLLVGICIGLFLGVPFGYYARKFGWIRDEESRVQQKVH